MSSHFPASQPCPRRTQHALANSRQPWAIMITASLSLRRNPSGRDPRVHRLSTTLPLRRTTRARRLTDVRVSGNKTRDFTDAPWHSVFEDKPKQCACMNGGRNARPSPHHHKSPIRSTAQLRPIPRMDRTGAEGRPADHDRRPHQRPTARANMGRNRGRTHLRAICASLAATRGRPWTGFVHSNRHPGSSNALSYARRYELGTEWPISDRVRVS